MEIKPCPFCGENEQEPMQTEDGDWYVRCNYCGAQGEQCVKKERSIDTWNTREDPKVRKEDTT